MKYTNTEQVYALFEDFEDAEDVRRELLAMYEDGGISREIAQAAWQKWKTAHAQ